MADKTNPVIDKLFSVGAHFGYAPSRRHPSVSQYIFGAKGGVELFDLEQVAALLAGALEFVKSMAAERKVILFVGGKAEAREALQRTAERLNLPYCASRWIGGTITNFSEIKRRLGRLEELTSMREKGELAKFTKKERLLIDREITELEEMFGGLRGLTRTPDALFVVDPRQEAGAVAEARQMGIPVVALMNSDCDKSLVTYPIPANDAAREVIQYVLNEVAEAYSGALPPAVPATN
ncbi:MAG TPA: 30S ribosomal protein S2 [Candidatus Paceibacterota bacterium]|jgi:small subunit ribosomal protein S2|nr:30S ribosomal protein S2 [Candidatus Paceibacterota bacterium]